MGGWRSGGECEERMRGAHEGTVRRKEVGGRRKGRRKNGGLCELDAMSTVLRAFNTCKLVRDASK